jgi:hypothetical protein
MTEFIQVQGLSKDVASDSDEYEHFDRSDDKLEVPDQLQLKPPALFHLWEELEGPSPLQYSCRALPRCILHPGDGCG